MGRITPVYPVTEGLGTRIFRQMMTQSLTCCRAKISDLIPEDVRRRHHFQHREAAFRNVHFPGPSTSIDGLNQFKSDAHRTLIFEEFLLDQVTHLIRRQHLRRGLSSPVLRATDTLRTKFQEILPFDLTGAQRKVLDDIIRDMSDGHPMNRLLQGDVGSGKTVVAIFAMMIALEAGRQAAIMAPTEVLAEQHFVTLKRLLGDRYPVFLLTGSTGPGERDIIRERLSEGRRAVFIGTHALIQEGVRFENLGIAVIDEQHKFGVRQRIRLARKGRSPHLLTMSATPIPRSMTLTLFGDLDCSVIDEMPPGRRAVKTVIRGEGDRPRIYQFILKLIREGDQVFFVCPMVDQSEKMDLKAAVALHRELQTSCFQNQRIALVHGQLKSEEKESAMRAFANHETDIMVATTVIEVGVDMPDARLMIIEHAERFGLSQLHQLRGRVGRGGKQSYCILMKSKKCSPEAAARLKIMTETNNGFIIAEKDLALRGPGDLLGTRQSGEPLFRIGNPVRDIDLLSLARETAGRIIEKDPGLSMPSHQRLYEMGRRRWERLFHGKMEPEA